MPVVCPPWEYSQVTGCGPVLAGRAKAALIRLRSLLPHDQIQIARDTRPLHGLFFAGLTPANFDYYAGHYRGEDFVCLKTYLVQIQSDPMVGHPPTQVVADMLRLADDLDAAISDGDFVWAVNSQVLAAAEKLYRVVQIAVAVFVYFLQIHPFANGNGHMARFALIAFLSRYGIYLSKFPFDPRPADPPYSDLIARYRRGQPDLLVRFVLSCI